MLLCCMAAPWCAVLCHAVLCGRVLYSSATGAAQPTNLAYLARLLPVGFKDTMDMVNTLRNAGLGSLELFCMVRTAVPGL